MKKQISLLLTFFAMAIMVHAQAPNAIPYQGVARNSSGSILASQAIRLRFTIHDVTSTGTTVYQETQAVTTSTLGLFNVNIGQGTIVSGTLSGVNWGTGAKFLQVEMDPAGGTNYISMGTTQLNSVPYALFAGGISNGAGWSLSGNAPPNDTSFIGTISNTSFNIRVNNQKAGRIDNTLRNSYYGLLSGNSNTTGGFNTGIGWSSLSANTGGNYNTAIGYGSLLSNTTGNGNLALGIYSLQSNTTGSFNAAIGYGALNSNTTGTGNFANGTNALYYNTTGNYNTANGYTALQNNTTGNYNNAIGYGALVSNTTGSYNSAAGYGALYYNTTGIGNAAYGPYALVYNGTGNYNTAMGDSALIQNYAGINNSAFGYNALSKNAGGIQNTAIGYRALATNTYGNNNTAVGDSADVASANLSNSTAVGYKAIAPASNTIQLGNTTIDSVMAGTLSANTKLVVPRLKITGGSLAANSVLTSDASGNATWQPSSLSGWSLSGNAGTVDGTNFIGTMDNTPLNFRVNNLRAGRINPLLANTFFGVQSGGLITTGAFNTANGNKALYSATSGAYNSANGDSALYANTTGSFNTAHGYAALASNTTGSNNTAIGDSADVTTGALTNATAIGYNAKVSANNTIQLGNTTIDSVMAGTLSANTKLVVPRLKITGGTLAANNILTSDALGNATWQPAAPSGWSLSGNAGTNPANNFIGTTDNQPFNIRVNNLKAGRIDSASANSFYGLLAGGSNSTGKGNTAIGDSALFFNTTGSFITAIGDSASVTTDGLVNATAIGHSAKVSASNTIQLGNAATDSLMAGSAADSTKLIIPRLRVTAGTPAVGQVLTATDVNGNAKWQTLPSGFPTATAPGQMVYWNGSAWVIVPAGSRGQTLTYCEGVPTWGACPAIYATVTTAVITGITNVSASGGGNVTYNGDANVTARGIVWGTDTLPSIATHLGITTDGSGNGAFTSSLTGLLASTKYHVRAYATNSVGTSYGVDTSFTTAAAAVPTVATVAPSAVGSTTANPGGNISSNGGATVSQSGIVYSTSNVAPTGPLAGLSPGTYSYTTDGNTSTWTSSLTGLSLGTTYYTYAYANNIAGTGYGTVQSFTTINTPTVTTTTVSSITATSASGGGNVTADGGATVTERGVCWGPSANPTTAGSHAAAGVAGTGSFVLNLSPLTGSTFYHYRAYATNSAGTSYGTDYTFTTTISLGDTYQGGKVFYLLQSGDPGYDVNVQHGLIAATADTSSNATWYNGSYTTTTATATSLGTGSANTTAIISSQGAGTYAASLCKAYKAGGLYPNVWYLPSKDELFILYTNQAYAGGFGFGSYWSSSEDNGDNTKAWIYSFAGGNPFSVSKSGTASVRPIRSF